MAYLLKGHLPSPIDFWGNPLAYSSPAYCKGDIHYNLAFIHLIPP